MPPSSRAGSTKGPKAAAVSETLDPKIIAMLVSKLDFVGTSDMQEIVTITLKNGQTIKMLPDGRQCCTCIFRDDQWDPLELMINRRNMYMHWGHVPKESGHTWGDQCHYCVSRWQSGIRFSRVPPITMAEFKQQLGSDASLLQKPCASIVQYCLNIVNSGQLKFPRNTDWDEVQRQGMKLTIIQRENLVQKRPGF